MADITKQPSESFMIAGSIINVGASGETITLGSSSASAVDADGTDVTSTFLDTGTLVVGDDPNGGTSNSLQVRVRDGTEAASLYKVTFLMVTSLGNTYEVDRTVKVKEQ